MRTLAQLIDEKFVVRTEAGNTYAPRVGYFVRTANGLLVQRIGVHAANSIHVYRTSLLGEGGEYHEPDEELFRVFKISETEV